MDCRVFSQKSFACDRVGDMTPPKPNALGGRVRGKAGLRWCVVTIAADPGTSGKFLAKIGVEMKGGL